MATTEGFEKGFEITLKKFNNDYKNLGSKPGQKTQSNTYKKQHEEETNHFNSEICTPMNDYEKVRRKSGEETPYSTYMKKDEENTEGVYTEIVTPKNEYEKVRRTSGEDSSYSSYTKQDEHNSKGVNTEIDTHILKNNYETIRRKSGEETTYSIYTKRDEGNNQNEITEIGTSMNDYEKVRTYKKQDEENTKGIDIETDIPKNDYEKVRRKSGEETTYSTCTKQGEEDSNNLYTETGRSASEINSIRPFSCNRKMTGLIVAILVGLIIIISVSVVVVIRSGTDSSNEPGEGLWSAWGDWTQCTFTCNSGIHKRYRSCNGQDSTECEGNFVETEICEETVCPVYGKWTTWGPWNSCDVTCGGGTHSRIRTCSKTDSTDLNCVGTNAQEKSCSDWECPDCSRECTFGKLNMDCDACVCAGTVITGRVRAVSTGNPISNAAFYTSTAPTKLLTQSNSTGFFILDNICTKTELIITREGFVDINITVRGDNIIINMTRTVLPYLTETPQAKKRLTGENVTLCCEAVANPPIGYFEWFKDGLLLDEMLYQNGNKLSLSDLTTTDNGRYQCRANSYAGSIMSPAATLRVKDVSDEFCADALQQKTIALPDDCIQARTNTATYEVGECISKSCRENTSTDTGTCREEISSCCAISNAVLETVQCFGYELELVIIKSCRCALCTKNSLTISGTALGVEDGSPLKYGEVRVNGVLTTYTSSTGAFNFIASKTTPKVIIHLQDSYFRKFLPAIKSVEITDEMSGALHVDIGMVQAIEPVEIESTTENILVAGASLDNTTTPIVQMSIPANAFYYPDGRQYNGTVDASFTFLDPTNTSVLGNIPGTFQIVDEEGQTANLASLAVFNLYFEDSSGQPLILDEVVDLYLPLELGEDVTNQDIKLWRMNSETGIWEYVTPGTGTRRRKRQNTALWIGEIDMATWTIEDWFNYDFVNIYTNSPCYFKIRLFTDKNLKTQVPNPKSKIHVNYHILKNSSILWTNTYLEKSEEECITAICEDYDAYIYLYYYGRKGYEYLYAGQPEIGSSSLYYKIMEDERVLKIKMSSKRNGPFYDNQANCKTSSSNNYHLKYHFGLTSVTYTYWKTFDSTTSAVDKRLSQRTWYPNRQSEGYRVCVMKVRTLFEYGLSLSPGPYIKLKATSYGGTNEDIRNFTLGIREYDMLNVTENSSICIEYKCSGTIDPIFEPLFDYTRVVLTLVDPTSAIKCNITEEADFVSSDSTYKNVAQIGSTDCTYEIYAPTSYSPEIGLYSATSDKLDIDSAYTTAEGECRSGEPQNINDYNPDKGVAVTFTLRPNK